MQKNAHDRRASAEKEGRKESALMQIQLSYWIK
jgi:hypothetical protein